MNKQEVLQYFRSDKFEELNSQDRIEIMIACCSQSDFLEAMVIECIEKEENRQKEI